MGVMVLSVDSSSFSAQCYATGASPGRTGPGDGRDLPPQGRCLLDSRGKMKGAADPAQASGETETCPSGSVAVPDTWELVQEPPPPRRGWRLPRWPVQGRSYHFADAGASPWKIASDLARKDPRAADAYVQRANRARLAVSGKGRLKSLKAERAMSNLPERSDKPPKEAIDAQR